MPVVDSDIEASRERVRRRCGRGGRAPRRRNRARRRSQPGEVRHWKEVSHEPKDYHEYILVYLWKCTARHNSCLPCAGTGFRYTWYYHRRVCRVSRVHVSCVVRRVFFCKNQITSFAWSNYIPARMQLLDLRTCVRAPASATRASLAFYFHLSFFFLRSPLLVCLINLPHGFNSWGS